MLGLNFFYYSKVGRKGNWPIGIHWLLKPSTKQERSAVWTFPDFIGDLRMYFGTEIAGSVCLQHERLVPNQSRNILAFYICMEEKQSPPQSTSLPILLLLAPSKLWGFSSQYEHIFVIFWSAVDLNPMACVLCAAPWRWLRLQPPQWRHRPCCSTRGKCLPAGIVCWPWWR